MMRLGLILAIMMLCALPAGAVEPGEILDDPALEARARDISKNLRCLVCRNQNIDESDAGLAKDLRIVVRERITAGDTDTQVIDFVTGRYGEYVLLRPRFTAKSAVLYLGGPLLLLIGGVAMWRMTRRGETAPTPAAPPLSDEERQRLEALMNRDGDR